MTPLSVVFLVLLVLWFTVGLIPLPFIGIAEHFPKRYPVVFLGVSALLLGAFITTHMLGW